MLDCYCLTKPSIKNFKDFEHRTPLAAACAYGQSHIMRLILNHPNIDIKSKDDKGHTVVLYAAKKGSIADIQLLLEYDKIPS